MFPNEQSNMCPLGGDGKQPLFFPLDNPVEEPDAHGTEAIVRDARQTRAAGELCFLAFPVDVRLALVLVDNLVCGKIRRNVR